MFSFDLSSGIGEVVATIAYWNKVSSASPHLVNVFDISEGTVRVGVVRYVGLLWIFTVGVSFQVKLFAAL